MSASDKSSPSREVLNQDKPRLTEEQKRLNHITSEQKRREAIRAGFDRLAEMVPGLYGAGRSEGYVINSSVAFMVERIAERKQLVERIEKLGGVVPEEVKEALLVDLDGIVLSPDASEQHEDDPQTGQNDDGNMDEGDGDQDEAEQNGTIEEHHSNGNGTNGTA